MIAERNAKVTVIESRHGRNAAELAYPDKVAAILGDELADLASVMVAEMLRLCDDWRARSAAERLTARSLRDQGSTVATRVIETRAQLRSELGVEVCDAMMHALRAHRRSAP